MRLNRPVDPARDKVRGGGVPDVVTVVAYVDFLCPYCRRLRQVFLQLRQALGDRLVFVFRHFPNERAHPGAERIARAAEAAAQQGRFWEMYDWLFEQELPISEEELLEFARSLGLDMSRFTSAWESDDTRRRVVEDAEEGRCDGVTGTPALFVDGIRYDGAWDFYSMLETLERPVAARVQRSARAFASLPASGGLVLLLAASAALLCANTPLRPYYEALVRTSFTLGPLGALSLTFTEWCSEGLLSIFFLLVGLEIRRELTAGALTDRRAATLPVVSAVGGVLVPAALYLALNPGRTAQGWAVPTATDVAFTIGIMALLGERTPQSLRIFIAALAVVDDVLSVLTLAFFFPHSFDLRWLIASGAVSGVLFTLNRWRVYAIWPYVAVTAVLWIALHAAGVHGALAGVILAAFLPNQPAPAPAPLLAQAATALAALEHAEKEVERAGLETRRVEEQAVWDWASRTLSAASARLLPTADRIESIVAPWSAYVILPLFAFSVTGIPLSIDLSDPGTKRLFAGIVLGLVIGKPLGVLLASWLATRLRVAVAPEGVTRRQFIGAACLCGIADTVALLIVERTPLSETDAASAKIAVLVGSGLAALLGTALLALHPRSVAERRLGIRSTAASSAA